MAFGRGKDKEGGGAPDAGNGAGVEDPTSWILNNEFANFVLMNTNEIVSLVWFPCGLNDPGREASP